MLRAGPLLPTTPLLIQTRLLLLLGPPSPVLRAHPHPRIGLRSSGRRQYPPRLTTRPPAQPLGPPSSTSRVPRTAAGSTPGRSRVSRPRPDRRLERNLWTRHALEGRVASTSSGLEGSARTG